MAKKPAPKKPAAKKPATNAKVPSSIKAAAGSEIQGISKDAFDKLMKRLKSPARDAADARSAMGGIISAAAASDNYHKGAGRVVRALLNMVAGDGKKKARGGVALGEWLFHFDLMREHAGLDTLAAADLFEDRKRREAEKQQADKAAKAEAKANGKDDVGAKPDMKSGAVSLADKRAEKEAAAKPTATSSVPATADPPPQSAAPLH